MAKTRGEKEGEVQAVADRLRRAKSVAVVAYRGLTVAATEKLRQQLREADGELIMVKKTLLKRALSSSNLDEGLGGFDGSLALAFSYRDEVSAAKTLAAFMVANPDVLVVEGGVVDGASLSRQQVALLASLPGRQELLAQLLRSLNGPVSGFVSVLGATVRSVVLAFAAIRDAKAA